MATIGVKSNMPVRGIMRRSGDRIGSVILSRSMVRAFGAGENQVMTARMKMAMVSLMTFAKKKTKTKNK